MNTKAEFYTPIWNYYNRISNGRIPNVLMVDLCNLITDYYYEQYNRFTLQYPKSLKRYSTFQVKDLEHPDVFEMVIKFFKDKLGDEYTDNAKVLLSKTDSELKAFEKNREDFHNMF